MTDPIPAADPNAGFDARVDRAIDELVAAIAASPRVYSPGDIIAMIDAKRRVL